MFFYLYCLLLIENVVFVFGYARQLYMVSNKSVDYFDLQCIPPPQESITEYPVKQKLSLGNVTLNDFFHSKPRRPLVIASTPTTTTEIDPAYKFEQRLHQFVFGPKIQEKPKERLPSEANIIQKLTTKEKEDDNHSEPMLNLDIYPDGQVMRSEMFYKKMSVHLPAQELHHPGHCRLRMTIDKMQTAVNAFAIFLYGNVDDILRLPSEYVLRSARTIAMMKIAHEKLAATWQVVKGKQKTIEIPHWTLELYRPLFKYLSGREMARLNLSDPRILTYIGTHAELTRHQVGIVASKYVKLNPYWLEPKYLNLMNNLLCGMPMNLMRKASSHVYLQLTHQVFYHIRACDSLQRRFYLHLMTKTEVLGKSYSWSARDVARLGLLLAELQGPEFAAINPAAMSGITAPVMLSIPPEVLQYVTETQLRYLAVKPLNILARKLKAFQNKQMNFVYNGQQVHKKRFGESIILYFAYYTYYYNNY